MNPIGGNQLNVRLPICVHRNIWTQRWNALRNAKNADMCWSKIWTNEKIAIYFSYCDHGYGSLRGSSGKNITIILSFGYSGIRVLMSLQSII